MNKNITAIVIHPWLKKKAQRRTAEACLEEAAGLAHAIDLTVADRIPVPMSDAKPSTLIGSGKVDEIKGAIAAADATLAIINHTLSPVQQRNLEKAWGVKVIDRTALILEIFGARARTHEGKLQVELAALEYQKSRLVRSWTHLERQRGGFGFLGGPGESQIEIDRRLIRDRIAKIKKQLEAVTRTRELHRKTRRDVPYPVIALVGYTNAGKSTLFNKLTGADVLSMDKLFATLDPTMRALKLPSGGKAILSDTVGFISDLPTELIAAFRATLEEVLEADILLHVRDITHPDTNEQKRDVEAVLLSLLDVDVLPDNVIEVLNKIDLLSPPPEGGRVADVSAEALAKAEGREGVMSNAEVTPSRSTKDMRSACPSLATSPLKGEVIKGKVGISALTGEGLDKLFAAVEKEMQKRFYTQKTFKVGVSDGKSLAWLHAHGKIVKQRIKDDIAHVTVQMSEENIQRFERLSR